MVSQPKAKPQMACCQHLNSGIEAVLYDSCPKRTESSKSWHLQDQYAVGNNTQQLQIHLTRPPSTHPTGRLRRLGCGCLGFARGICCCCGRSSKPSQQDRPHSLPVPCAVARASLHSSDLHWSLHRSLLGLQMRCMYATDAEQRRGLRA